MNKIAWKVVFVIALLMILVSFTGASFTHINEWYYNLHKPAFQPPNWLFAPVWTVLYILIGVAAYLMYMNRKDDTRLILTILVLNLIFNILWSYLFFTQHNLLLALLDLILVWITILVVIVKTRPIKNLAAWLLVPYFLWVGFAGILNYYILILNT